MRGLTGYVPKWEPGLPTDDGRNWLGESADGRQWLLRWAPQRQFWLAMGYDARWGDGKDEYPEMRGHPRGKSRLHRPAYGIALDRQRGRQ